MRARAVAAPTDAVVRGVVGGVFGSNGVDGGQRQAVRVPFADGTLVRVPGSGHSGETLRSLPAPRAGCAVEPLAVSRHRGGRLDAAVRTGLARLQQFRERCRGNRNERYG